MVMIASIIFQKGPGVGDGDDVGDGDGDGDGKPESVSHHINISRATGDHVLVTHSLMRKNHSLRIGEEKESFF